MTVLILSLVWECDCTHIIIGMGMWINFRCREITTGRIRICGRSCGDDIMYTSLPPGRSIEYATMKFNFSDGDLRVCVECECACEGQGVPECVFVRVYLSVCL